MEWIDINDRERHPEKEGMYVVSIVSHYGPSFAREHVLRVILHIDKDKKLAWRCSNRIVTHYLKED